MSTFPIFTLVLVALDFSIAASPGKIVHGELAKPGELYYMVDIMVGKRSWCGGALLDDKHVLTAAHCMYVLTSTKRKSLNIAVDNLRSDGFTAGKRYRVDKIQNHEAFNMKTVENDISILTLSEPVEFNERVGAVKLPVSDVKNGTQATVSGWGIMGESNKVRSKYLRKLSVTVYDRKSCQIHMLRNMDKKFKIRMHYSEICGFTHDNVGYGTCPGDSGGPLVTDDGYIVGIVSSGTGACGIGALDLYTDVYKYVDWINEIINV